MTLRIDQTNAVTYEVDEGVALVTIDNPPRNQLSAEVVEHLGSVVHALDRNSDAAVIVIAGAGESTFVAGADIKQLAATREARLGGAPHRGVQWLGEIIASAKTPSIAAVHGYCLGGGLELAVCCDIRIAADDAKFGQPEIKLGLIPGGGGTQRLPRLVGPGRAMLLNLTGDVVSAATAYEWGLVERVVGRSELLAEAMAVARTIARHSPFALGALKELAWTARDLPLDEGLAAETRAFLRCLGSADGIEGVAAFIEKRPPMFGRSRQR